MSDSIEELLSNCPPDVRVISRALRTMIKRAMPKAYELVYHATICYLLSESWFDLICYIAPQRNYANLGFFFGTHLPDPQHLLVGEGSRMRHIKVKSVEEAGNPALETLVKAALADAPDSVAKLHAKRRKRK